MDGCFDMMHYGHANALRQVRLAGYTCKLAVALSSNVWLPSTGRSWQLAVT